MRVALSVRLALALLACLAWRAAAGQTAAGRTSGGEALPQDLEDVLSQARARLCQVYQVPQEACGLPIEVRIAQAGQAESSGLPGFAAGAADPRVGLIVLVPSKCGGYPFGDVPQTLRHEVSHVLLFRSLGYSPPRWLDEGLAMRAAGEWGLADEVYSVLALHAVARGNWRLEKVEADFQAGEGSVRRSYALARGFVRALFPRDDEVTDFLLDARRLRSVDKAFGVRFGMPPEQAFQAWAKNLPWWGEWLVAASAPGVLWTLVTALFIAAAVAAYVRRKRRFEELPD